MRIARTCAIACLALLLAPTVQSMITPSSALEMAAAADDFIASLTSEQRAQAQFDFDDDERMNWHYVPRERRGLPFKEMTASQEDIARRLLQTGLSERGYLTANTIIELELVLRELGQNPAVRDPELYYFSVFGSPTSGDPWGWRVEGHHLSLNFTVIEGLPVATAPAFFGANPAEVRDGTRQGLRTLGAEEDLGRELVRSLDDDQRAVAIIDVEAPRDIITENAVEIDPLSPVGIRIADLRSDQAARLVELVDYYLFRMADDIAAERRARIQESDYNQIAVAWAGSVEPGEPHYYRVQGPTFLIEFDNTQNNANHTHTVWRDFDGDFGRDLLREHYANAPHPH